MATRDDLIAAGWRPPVELPPLTEEQYESWRPALAIYCVLAGATSASDPLDRIDRNKIDMLREVLAAAPAADDLPNLTSREIEQALAQWRDDLRFPPDAASKARRFTHIESLIAKLNVVSGS